MSEVRNLKIQMVDNNTGEVLYQTDSIRQFDNDNDGVVVINNCVSSLVRGIRREGKCLSLIIDCLNIPSNLVFIEQEIWKDVR